MNIRLFPKIRIEPNYFVIYGTLTPSMLEYLALTVRCYANIVIAGSTGSGKTTLMNVLSQFIPKKDRVVLVEDTQELQVNGFSVISLEAPHRKKLSEDQQT